MKNLPNFSADVITQNLLAAVAVAGCIALSAVVLVSAEDQDAAESAPSVVAGNDSGTEASPASSSLRAVELLRRSRDELLLRKSVSATLQEQVAIGGSKFQAVGSYEAGEFPKLRLSFQIQVGNTTGSLLEVCDRQLLWSVQEIRHGADGEPIVKASRTVIDDLLHAVEDSQNVPEAVLIANLGMGGLPTLLAALERTIDFDAHKIAEFDGARYAVIQGRWNDDYRARLGGRGGQSLPDYIPDRVRIYFDQQTLFPMRVLYLKEMTGASGLKTYQLLLSLEFSDVVLDGPVSEEQFRYIPPEGTQFENRTVKFLEMIKSAKEQAATAGETP